ncbi:MAG: PQQ-binding-like beta-propeller repeat protein [Fimbriiglobus sp.]
MTATVVAFLIAASLQTPVLLPAPADWPQFRGPNRDGVSHETGLLKSWPETGPTKLWTVTKMGGGYSTVSVVGDTIYATGLRDKSEDLFALDLKGEPKWSYSMTKDAKKVGYGEGPRSTPTVANGKVYAVSMGGELVCVDAKSGEKIWSKNYVTDFEGKIQAWGYSESVLVDEGFVIGTPCSKAHAMVALDANTGELKWSAKVPDAGGAGGYSSPMSAKVGDIPLYINLLGKSGGVVGVHAKTGKVLFQYTKIMNGTANIPNVIVFGDSVFASTGYGDGGSALLKLSASGDKVEVKEVKYYRANELQNHHGGMVQVNGTVFLGHAHNQGFPAAVDLSTGEINWKQQQGALGGDGSGAIAYADGMIYIRYQNGKVVLLEANPKEFKPVSSFTIPDKSGKPSWPHPTISGGKLYIRDQDKLHCFDLTAGK